MTMTSTSRPQSPLVNSARRGGEIDLVVTLMVGFALASGGCTPAVVRPSLGAAVPAAAGQPAAPGDSTPVLNLADLDSTTSPCEDFYQYAVGGWYRRTPVTLTLPIDIPRKADWIDGSGVELHGLVVPEPLRIGTALRQFLQAAPALAATTTDPTTRVLGNFYGSCLTDATGAVEGAVGDTLRTTACLRLTLRHMDAALVTLVLQRVWPPEARAQSRMLWTNMLQSAGERFQTSTVLQDSTKQRLASTAAALRLKVLLSATDSLYLLPFLDSLALAWDRVSATPSYASLALAPNHFAENLARVREAAAADSTLLSPARRERLRHVIETLLFDDEYSAGSTVVLRGLSVFVPPRVGGVVDLGGWYGTVGHWLGHEITHNFDSILILDPRRRAEYRQLAAEQLRGQVQWVDGDLPIYNVHPFDDHFGVLLAYGAFERAMQGQSRPRLDGLTPEQRFFLGIAQGGFRGGRPSRSARANTLTRWRVFVNGALSAMPAFAQAFGCPAGAPMAGGHVWYQDPWYAPTTARRQFFYQEFARGLWARLSAPSFHWTPAQQTTLDHLRATLYGPQQAALIDSVGAAGAVEGETKAGGSDESLPRGHWRLLTLMLQQLGDLRGELGLTSEQREHWDRLTQEWQKAADQPR